MNLNENYEIQAIINPLLEKKAWDVRLGVGSFITMNFGNPNPKSNKENKISGEWYLWVYMCGWRLEKQNQFIAGCEDSRKKLEKDVKLMEGLAIKSIEILPYFGDTTIYFDQEVILRLFAIYSQDDEIWQLFTPDGNVLSIQTCNIWSVQPSNLEY
jgi:hypothetical protein